MEHVVERLGEGVSLEAPPLDPALRALAESELGVRLSPR
jgi:hypothetical protein